ncbi:MAG: hypothetical protein U0802_13830 [Candidatus Binatia bacterium]
MSGAAPRAVLWDMDGTLVDSGDLHYAAWRETLRGLGRDLPRAAFDATFGQRNDAVLRRLVDPAIDAAAIARIGDAKEAQYRALVAARGVGPAGALDWVRRSPPAGARPSPAPAHANAAAILTALDLHDARCRRRRRGRHPQAAPRGLPRRRRTLQRASIRAAASCWRTLRPPRRRRCAGMPTIGTPDHPRPAGRRRRRRADRPEPRRLRRATGAPGRRPVGAGLQPAPTAPRHLRVASGYDPRYSNSTMFVLLLPVRRAGARRRGDRPGATRRAASARSARSAARWWCRRTAASTSGSTSMPSGATSTSP